MEQHLETAGGRPAVLDGPAAVAAVGTVAQEAEQRLDDRVAGGEVLDLLLLHRGVAPERAEHGALLAELSSPGSASTFSAWPK